VHDAYHRVIQREFIDGGDAHSPLQRAAHGVQNRAALA
jgi:hypothetical protein